MKAKAKPKIRTRDYLLVKLICGATKAGTHKDRKKEGNKRACRGPLTKEEYRHEDQS